MTFILRYDARLFAHTRHYPGHEFFYFLAHGETAGAIKLISHTTPDKANARRFGSLEEATAVLASSGNPPNWAVCEDVT